MADSTETSTATETSRAAEAAGTDEAAGAVGAVGAAAAGTAPAADRVERYINLQRALPVIQFVALPLYWLIGRGLFGLGGWLLAAFTMLAPFATHAVILGFGFLIAYRNQHADPTVRNGRRRDWLIAWLNEIAVSLRAFYWLMPFRERFVAPEPVPPVVPLPVLMVHGYGCNRGLWLPASRFLAAHGYTVDAVNLAPIDGPIDRYGAVVAAGIERLRSRTGAHEVALVCHSMGGLAARAYLRDCAAAGVDPAVARLITLGTPHRGTHLARLGVGANAQQMRYGSDWLVDLDHGELGTAPATEPPALRRRITTINSLQDNIVTRPHEQRLAGARAIVVGRIGHMSLASSRRVLRVVDRVLRRAAPASRAT
ncbi:MAG: esterase/lipase family protein [Lautropia sp.]